MREYEETPKIRLRRRNKKTKKELGGQPEGAGTERSLGSDARLEELKQRRQRRR